MSDSLASGHELRHGRAQGDWRVAMSKGDRVIRNCLASYLSEPHCLSNDQGMRHYERKLPLNPIKQLKFGYLPWLMYLVRDPPRGMPGSGES